MKKDINKMGNWQNAKRGTVLTLDEKRNTCREITIEIIVFSNTFKAVTETGSLSWLPNQKLPRGTAISY